KVYPFCGRTCQLFINESLDAQEVKQYFPVDRVIAGVLKVYQSLLGVTFREVQGGSLWHRDVRLYEITDPEDGGFKAHFYLDLHPREGKFSHAAAFNLLKGRAGTNGYDSAASAIVANFSKPSPGKPALMSHDEVLTLFHEFGHVMHHTLTRARHLSFSGSAVARDFVEAPSQMMENFAWEKEVLTEVSGHWETGEPLPAPLLDKMIAARRFNMGLSTLRQIALASADMALFSLVPKDPSATFNEVYARVMGNPLPPGSNMAASFGHLLGGYGAGYYGYYYSLVGAQDIYSMFTRPDSVRSETGRRYRRTVLEPGSEVPESDSLKNFLGREPSEDAFMRMFEDAPSS
ncbi:MAG: M3 family metallopeptidase, partial [Elusimicrobiota bacterium]